MGDMENWLLCARLREPGKKIDIFDNYQTDIVEKGLYVIEPSGEEFVITVPEGVYSPRVW